MKRYRILVVCTLIAAWLVLGVRSATFAADFCRTEIGSSETSKELACLEAKTSRGLEPARMDLAGDSGYQCKIDTKTEGDEEDLSNYVLL